MEVLFEGRDYKINKGDVFEDFECLSFVRQPSGVASIGVKCRHCSHTKTIAPFRLLLSQQTICKCQKRKCKFSEEEILNNDKLIGSKVGRWTVVSRATELSKPSISRAQSYHCVCDCGNTAEVKETFLRRFLSTSCGCNRTKHALSGSRLYRVWGGMHRRCYEPKEDSYCNYGAKGIKVCDEWYKSINFLNWALENGYEEGLTLERRDNDLDYSPENCTWVTKADQNRNKKMDPRNTSGYTGVSKDKSAYISTWSINNKTHYKRFPIKKYGEELAELMAIEYRAYVIDMLKLQGIYYGEKHGL